MSSIDLGIIVYAESSKDARLAVEYIMEHTLCRDSSPFDYYSVLHVHNTNSKVAQKKVGELHGDTKSDFAYYIQEIRKVISTGASNDDLFEGDQMFKHYAHKAGEYHGSAVHLYDNDGEGIRDSRHLQNALKKWPNLEGRYTAPDGDVWLVVCNAHF